MSCQSSAPTDILCGDEKLPVLFMAYRFVTHETMGYSLAKLMFGLELQLPVDLLTGKALGKALPALLIGLSKDKEVHH